MVQSITTPVQSIEATEWTTLCSVTEIAPNTGVNALIDDKQVAIFRIGETDELYAVGNFDPFSQAYVMSRGIIGDRQGILKVASPIYKQNFNLKTGQCLDDDKVKLPIYPVRVLEGNVQVNPGCFQTSSITD